jgi:hypothetical protein
MAGLLARFGWLITSCSAAYIVVLNHGGGVPCLLTVIAVVYLSGIILWYKIFNYRWLLKR